jgi:hypothetical protein
MIFLVKASKSDSLPKKQTNIELWDALISVFSLGKILQPSNKKKALGNQLEGI